MARYAVLSGPMSLLIVYLKSIFHSLFKY